MQRKLYDKPLKEKNAFRVIGLMSGTSMDGLDIACCTYTLNNNRWKWEIVCAVTNPYSAQWRQRLQDLEHADAFGLALTDAEYGHYIGRQVGAFIRKNKLNPDFISSHGHTIFHRPGKKLSTQIGSGAAIAAESGYPVVCDFRTRDVAQGGQGAPLVPAGERYLFPDYPVCLNLGGIANMTLLKNKTSPQAWDICPVNIILNDLSRRTGKQYDDQGRLARKGRIIPDLLDDLNNLALYRQGHTKSLGREAIAESVFPLINKQGNSVPDLLRTSTEHIAMQIGKTLRHSAGSGSVLVTGGGAYNKFLLERIAGHCPSHIILPEKKIIDFKEAIIFGFLGVLRWRGEINCYKSVTGAKKDTIGGAVYL